VGGGSKVGSVSVHPSVLIRIAGAGVRPCVDACAIAKNIRKKRNKKHYDKHFDLTTGIAPPKKCLSALTVCLSISATSAVLVAKVKYDVKGLTKK
jgi:hypothetical protein